MASGTSSRRAELLTLAALDERIGVGVPLLAVRLPQLERLAWRAGLRAARRLERRASGAFAASATHVLRAGDLLAHDPASDLFAAALVAPVRAPELAVTVDARAALARIATAMEAATGLEITTGWTTVGAADRAALDDALARALVLGEQERERFAFFSALGHELRTPLSSIRGYLETLLDDGVDPPTRRRFLTIAHSEALRLGRLVDGMFEISLLDLHAGETRAASAVVEPAIRAAADACAAHAAVRAARIVVAPGAYADARVGIDADRLTLVVVNLVDNALKHGRRGGTVRVGALDAAPGTLRLTVDDDGPGIAVAERERIFRLGERGSTGAHGEGIGLALVRLLVERAGGRVAVAPSPLGGARFIVNLPAVGTSGAWKPG